MRTRALDLPAALLLLTLASWATGALAQKVEREIGLRAAEAPAPVQTFLDSAFAQRRRTRYYRDIGEDAVTVEAKFRLGDTRYSVEFDTLGRWRDTEVEVPVAAVPAAVWSRACAAWGSRYERYRVARVQDHTGRAGERYYEIELRGRREREWSAFQYRVAPDGTLLDRAEIELSPGHLSRW